MSILSKTLLGMAIIGISMQFHRPVKNLGPGAPDARDLTAHHPAPPEIKTLLENTCYDCHSNTTRYPWYAEIQPVGWWLAWHVNDGKKHLNFSTFADYTPKRAARKLEESAELIREGEMPLPSYKLAHAEARLTPEQTQRLADWFAAVRARIIEAVPATSP